MNDVKIYRLKNESIPQYLIRRGVNLVEELVRIQNKESGLSKDERDAVVEYFRSKPAGEIK